MPRRFFFAAIVLFLADAVLTAGLPQTTPRGASTLFRNARGIVVADDAAQTPLRRVRVDVSGGTIVASPAYTDDFGRFEILVPASAPFGLTFTKTGFARYDTSPTVTQPAGDLQITLARGAAVTGRVTDQYGDPLVVRVHVRRVVDDAGPGVQPTEWQADSDDLGEYRVGGLPAGPFEVTLDPPSPPGSGDVPRPSSSKPLRVDLRAGEEATVNLIEEMPPMDPRGRVIGSTRTPTVENGGAINGRVLATDARSVGGAFVILTAGIDGARETTTDHEGRFEFSGLPAGSYRITAAKLGTALTMRDRPTEVTIVERQAHPAITVVMQRPSAVTGTVSDQYGEPMEGLTVELWRPVTRDGRRVLRRPGAVSPHRTDDRGRYRLFRVTAGEYFVTAGEEPRLRRGVVVDAPDSSMRVYYPGTPVVAEAIAVRVATGLDTTGIDISHAPLNGARVYGSAFDSTGQPLRYPVTLLESSRSGRPIQAERTAHVRDDGAFEFSNVPPGDYVVQATLRPTPGRAREFAAAFVTVAAADAPPLTIRTSRGTRVRGRVVFEGDTTRARPDSFGVAARATDPDYSEIGMDSPSAGVEEDGTVELYLQGPMRIESTAAPEGWWLKSATVGSVDATDEPYTFPANGRALAMTLVFSDAASEVSGRVVDERGRGVRDAVMLAFSTDTRRWLASRYVKSRRSGGGGTFRVSPLPPGDYWIVAVERLEQNELRDVEVLETLARSAQRVTLYERQRLARDLPLVRR
jgi:hypothetical protein